MLIAEIRYKKWKQEDKTKRNVSEDLQKLLETGTSTRIRRGGKCMKKRKD